MEKVGRMLLLGVKSSEQENNSVTETACDIYCSTEICLFPRAVCLQSSAAWSNGGLQSADERCCAGEDTPELVEIPFLFFLVQRVKGTECPGWGRRFGKHWEECSHLAWLLRCMIPGLWVLEMV